MEFLLQKEKFSLSSLLYLVHFETLKLWNLLRKTAALMLSDY